MKVLHPKLTFAPALLALALATVPAVSRADESAPTKKLTKAQEKFDADNDGKLSDEERARAREEATAKAKKTREEHRKIALEKYDANGDGKLDDAEKAKMKADEETAREEKKAERAARKAERDAKKAAKDGAAN
ncbi:MAG TPA: hypothetical protein VL200_04495 [Lacunisphaera sp.]|jgi:hypothetical protein|nr:hypothetical protein [Lacunisphaera sp.]